MRGKTASTTKKREPSAWNRMSELPLKYSSLSSFFAIETDIFKSAMKNIYVSKFQEENASHNINSV